MIAYKECPDCLHIDCPEGCGCNCDAARAEEKAACLDAAVASLTADRDAYKLAAESASRATDVIGAERNAARSERDASNAKRESQWKELQAARAGAAAKVEANLIREEQVALCISALDEIFSREGMVINRDDVAIYWRLKKTVRERPAVPTDRTALLAEVARLRDENAALGGHLLSLGVERDRDVLRATNALGRAHAALREAQHDIGLLTGQDDGIIKHQRLCAVYDMIRASLEDPTGRAAGEYVSALEVEHTEIERLGSNLHGFITLMAAHAAVEALRGDR